MQVSQSVILSLIFDCHILSTAIELFISKTNGVVRFIRVVVIVVRERASII